MWASLAVVEALEHIGPAATSCLWPDLSMKKLEEAVITSLRQLRITGVGALIETTKCLLM